MRMEGARITHCRWRGTGVEEPDAGTGAGVSMRDEVWLESGAALTAAASSALRLFLSSFRLLRSSFDSPSSALFERDLLLFRSPSSASFFRFFLSCFAVAAVSSSSVAGANPDGTGVDEPELSFSRTRSNSLFCFQAMVGSPFMPAASPPMPSRLSFCLTVMWVVRPSPLAPRPLPDAQPSFSR